MFATLMSLCCAYIIVYKIDGSVIIRLALSVSFFILFFISIHFYDGWATKFVCFLSGLFIIIDLNKIIIRITVIFKNDTILRTKDVLTLLKQFSQGVNNTGFNVEMLKCCPEENKHTRWIGESNTGYRKPFYMAP